MTLYQGHHKKLFGCQIKKKILSLYKNFILAFALWIIEVALLAPERHFFKHYTLIYYSISLLQ